MSNRTIPANAPPVWALQRIGDELRATAERMERADDRLAALAEKFSREDSRLTDALRWFEQQQARKAQFLARASAVSSIQESISRVAQQLVQPCGSLVPTSLSLSEAVTRGLPPVYLDGEQLHALQLKVLGVDAARRAAWIDGISASVSERAAEAHERRRKRDEAFHRLLDVAMRHLPRPIRDRVGAIEFRRLPRARGAFREFLRGIVADYRREVLRLAPGLKRRLALGDCDRAASWIERVGRTHATAAVNKMERGVRVALDLIERAAGWSAPPIDNDSSGSTLSDACAHRRPFVARGPPTSGAQIGPSFTGGATLEIAA